MILRKYCHFIKFIIFRTQIIISNSEFLISNLIKLSYRLDSSSLLVLTHLADGEEALLVRESHACAWRIGCAYLLLVDFEARMRKAGEEFGELDRG